MKKTGDIDMVKIREIYVRSDSKLYGDYYTHNNVHLNNELLKHLVLIVSDVKLTESLEIQIWQQEADDNDKFISALKNSLRDTILGVRKEIRGNTIVAIVSLFIGILVGLLSAKVPEDKEYLGSVFLIAFWVFIWYSVETYVFDNFRLNLQVLRYQQLMNAKIRFKKIDE